jgi:hypothetical protein
MEHTNNKFDRDEVFNTLIQIYSMDTHDEIIERLDLIEDIKRREMDQVELSFLINQDVIDLEEMLFDLKNKNTHYYGNY